MQSPMPITLGPKYDRLPRFCRRSFLQARRRVLRSAVTPLAKLTLSANLWTDTSHAMPQCLGQCSTADGGLWLTVYPTAYGMTDGLCIRATAHSMASNLWHGLRLVTHRYFPPSYDECIGEWPSIEAAAAYWTSPTCMALFLSGSALSS